MQRSRHSCARFASSSGSLEGGGIGTGLRRKTHVVVTDEIDDYNGFAGVYPFPSVVLYANSPDDRAELNDYDDWLTDLFMHEYTHVIHTGTIGGPCAKTVNAVLGPLQKVVGFIASIPGSIGSGRGKATRATM